MIEYCFIAALLPATAVVVAASVDTRLSASFNIVANELLGGQDTDAGYRNGR